MSFRCGELGITFCTNASNLKPFRSEACDTRVNHIIPRAKSASRISTGDFSKRNTIKSDFASSIQSVPDENLSLVENLLLERVKDKKEDLKASFEIKKNYSLIEKALQVFDITVSGFVSQEDLRSVLSNFLFPLDDNIVRELLNRTGFISRDDLCRALESLNFHLTDEQFSALADVLDEEHTEAIN